MRTRTDRRNINRARLAEIEPIESRLLFHFFVASPVADLTVPPGTATSTVDLNNVVNSDELSGSLVRFQTTLGNIDLHLFDARKPNTVTNFLKYVNGSTTAGGNYDGTIVHRDADLTDVPPSGVEVLQGGGYLFPTFTHIPTDAAVADELTASGVISNTTGTIAMAKSGANTATSEWFINTGNNISLDNASVDGGFTVFGEVINGTMSVVEAIDDLTPVPGDGGDPFKFNFGGAFTTLPLRNYTKEDFDAGTAIDDDNIVQVNNATTLTKVTYAASSSNPSLVAASVDGNALTLTYGAGQEGDAVITVTGTAFDGSVVTDTFEVTVGAVEVTIGDGAARAVTFTDADGTVATVSLKGGTATVGLNGTGLTQATGKKGITITGTVPSLAGITGNGTSAASTLTVKAKGGNGVIDVEEITASGGLKSLSGKVLSVTGNVNLGPVGKLDLRTLAGGSITAASIAKLNVAGELTGDVTVTGALSSGKVAGGASGGTWNVGGISKLTVIGALASDVNAGSIGSVKFGSLSGADIVASGAIGKVTAAGITGSRIVSNVSGSTLPDGADDLGAGGSIAGITNKGTFSNSIIAAETLGKVTLGIVSQSNGGTAFGVAGASIASVAGIAGGGAVKLTRLETSDQSFDLEDFEVRVF